MSKENQIEKYGDGEKMVRELLADGPLSTRTVVAQLYPYLDDEEIDGQKLGWAIRSALSCPGTWHIPIGEDNGLLGLDEQPKPGYGTTKDAAEFLGLVELHGLGAYVPKEYLNR